MNVFKYDRPLKFILRHPFQYIRFLCRAILKARQRALKGFCDWDVWDMDYWLTHVLPPMFTEMAENCHGYPGCEPFETPEKWDAWLRSMAKDLTSLQEDWTDTRNEYGEQFFGTVDDLRVVEHTKDGFAEVKYKEEPDEELRSKWSARCDELFEEQQEFAIKTFSDIGRYLSCLWD